MLSNFGVPHWVAVIGFLIILFGVLWWSYATMTRIRRINRMRDAITRSACHEAHRTVMAPTFTKKPTTRSVAKTADDEYQRGGRTVKRTFQKKK